MDLPDEVTLRLRFIADGAFPCDRSNRLASALKVLLKRFGLRQYKRGPADPPEVYVCLKCEEVEVSVWRPIGSRGKAVSEMRVLSTAGDSLCSEPFACVERDGPRLRLKVVYRLHGVKYDDELALPDEAFSVLLAAMVRATIPKGGE